MRSRGLWALSLACAVGCESGDDGTTGVPGASGSTSAGFAGATPKGGAAGAAASGGAATGGVANGGAGGSATTAGGGSAGASMSGGGGSASGGASTAGNSSSAGSASGGRSSGGRNNAGGGGSGGAATGGRSDGANGGTSQKAGSGGGGTTASAGAGGCVENLACKLQAPPTTGDLHQDCVDRINQFRTQCACLPPLVRRTDGEACADEMAQYDAEQNEAHAGHSDKICEPSGSQNSCPGYSSNNQVIGLCLQQMWDEGPPDMDPCNGACFQEYGHFINMTSTSTTKVACGFFTTAAGKVWAVQNFSR